MSKFDESKVINCLHLDKAEIGKKYCFGDSLYGLKRHVENGDVSYIGMLTDTVENDEHPFLMNDRTYWQLVYPYEEK